MELSYTSQWPGGIEVVTTILGDVANDSIQYPEERPGCGRALEITKRRELTGLERHLVDQLRAKSAALPK